MRPKDAGDLSKGFEPDPTRSATQLNFRAAVAINTDTGAAPGDLDLPYCQIGSTGVIIPPRTSSSGCRTSSRFRRASIPPPSTSIRIGRGSISAASRSSILNTLVESLPERLDLEKWFIGRGGVTGKATAVLDLDPDMSVQDFAVRAFRLAFQQNLLLEGLVQLAVKLPFFDDRVVYLDLAITNEPTSTSRNPSGSWARSPASNPRRREPPRRTSWTC